MAPLASRTAIKYMYVVVTHAYTRPHVMFTHWLLIISYCIVDGVANALTENSQTSELANMWQCSPEISHQITVEQMELPSVEVGIHLNRILSVLSNACSGEHTD